MKAEFRVFYWQRESPSPDQAGENARYTDEHIRWF